MELSHGFVRVFKVSLCNNAFLQIYLYVSMNIHIHYARTIVWK